MIYLRWVDGQGVKAVAGIEHSSDCAISLVGMGALARDQVDAFGRGLIRRLGEDGA